MLSSCVVESSPEPPVCIEPRFNLEELRLIGGPPRLKKIIFNIKNCKNNILLGLKKLIYLFRQYKVNTDVYQSLNWNVLLENVTLYKTQYEFKKKNKNSFLYSCVKKNYIFTYKILMKGFKCKAGKTTHL